MDYMKDNKEISAEEAVILWQASRLSLSKSYEKAPEILKVHGSVIGTLGNFSASIGKAKSKKTFNVSAIVAATLKNGTVLRYVAELPEDKRKILYVDTEQSPYHCLKVMKRILRMAGLPDDRDNEHLEFLALRKYTPEQRIRIVEQAIYNTPDIALVIIDGIRDMVYDINSPCLLYTSEFVKECGNQNNWTASTYEKFSAVKNHLKEFKEDVTFEYFNEFGLNEYVNFLRDKKDMRNSTIGKQMGFLKWFLRWSFKKGHHQNMAYDTFKPKLKTTSKKVIFLTWDELNRLKDYQIPKDKQYLERVRDVFLFCCFTSLRYSDVRNLKRSDVKPDHIEVTTVKTADSLIIELNDHSKAILEKYKEVHFENHMVLPVISNQKMNDYLKELGELAEINEPVRETYYKGNERIDEVTPKYALLSTHAGRRTFICNALALGIPAQVVMKWTGHSDYKAMKPYIDIADDIKANAMNKFNQL